MTKKLPYFNDGLLTRIKREMRLTDNIFSYDHAKLKQPLYFNTDLLERIRLQKPEYFRLTTLEVSPEIYDLVVNQFGIEESHLPRIDDERLKQPGLGAHFDDMGFVLVDGSHRLVKRYRRGMRTFDVYVTTREVWELCLIDPGPVMKALFDSERPPIPKDAKEQIPINVTVHED